MPTPKLIGRYRLWLVALLIGVSCSYGTAAGQAAARNELVSVRGPNAVSADRETLDSVATPDGRYVAFSTFADNLVAGDNNFRLDVFEVDLLTGTVTLVSRNLAGTGSGNADSTSPSVSADGRYVAFSSSAFDLVSTPASGGQNVYVRDMQTGTTTLVSVNSAGTGGGNGGSSGPAGPVISADGRVVVFASTASNLVTNDTNGTTQDVFARDLVAGTTVLVSVNSAGTGSGNGASGNNAFALPMPPAVSADGRYVVFASTASNLAGTDGNNTTDVFRRDLQTGTTALVSVTLAGDTGTFQGSYSPVLSADGRYVAFTSDNGNLVPNDTNTLPDVFRRDMQTGTTALVSMNLSGNPGGLSTFDTPAPALSSDGRYVAFVSDKPGFVANDTNGKSDVFRRDMDASTTALASVNTAGTNTANNESLRPAISADGRVVAFVSLATDLVSNDANIYYDVFAHDFAAGTTRLVSVNSANTTSGNGMSGGMISLLNGARLLRTPVVSADGRYVLFASQAFDLVAGDANGVADIFRRDLLTNHTELISRNGSGDAGGNASANAISGSALMSADGRYVVFGSSAGDLVPNDANGKSDVFRRDILTGATVLVSVNSAGTSSGNATAFLSTMTPDGRYVAFTSSASDLVPDSTGGFSNVYVRDLVAGTSKLVSVNRTGTGGGNLFSSSPALSADGRYVAFRSSASDLVANNDFNNQDDTFVRDTVAGTTVLVSVNSTGEADGSDASAGPQISADGRYVAFLRGGQVFVRDLLSATTTLVSVSTTGGNGNGSAANVVMTPNGRYVAFMDNANNLVANDTNAFNDVFVRDLLAGTTTLVSVNSAGTASGNKDSITPAISPDGRFVAFYSTAGDLVTNDTNNAQDVFRRDLQTGTTVLVSANSAGTDSGNRASGSSGTVIPPALSADGRYVLFISQASNLAANDLNGITQDAFIRDVQAGVTRFVSINAAGTGSGDSASDTPVLSADGRYASFSSGASNLAANDNNFTSDVFRYSVNVAGQLQFSTTGYAAGEGDGQTTVTVTRVGGSDGAVSVNYATSNGTAVANSDYVAQSGTLTFADGDATPKTFTVPIIDNTVYEPSETVNLTLSAPTGGAGLGTPSAAVLTINDNDPQPVLKINSVTLPEGGAGAATGAVFTVSLVGASAATTTVNYATADATASAGSDYQSANGTLTFAPGEVSKNISVSINGDTIVEPDETFTVSLSNAVGAVISTGSGTCTITNDDPGTQFNISGSVTDPSAGGISGVTMILHLDQAGTTLVTQTDANGNYAFLNLPAGQNSVRLTPSKAGLNFSPQSSGIVSTRSLDGNNTINFGGGMLFVALLSGAQVVPPSNSNGSGVGEVTLSADETRAFVSLHFGLQGFQTQAHIHGPANPGANGSTQFVLPTGPVSNLLISLSPTQAQNLKAGRLYFDIHTQQFPNGEIRGQIIVPPALVLFGAANYNVAEQAGSATLTVTRSGDLSGTTTVGYQTVDDAADVGCADTVNNHGAAYARCDYATTLDTLTFAPGETQKTINVPIVNDAHVEGSETFQVQLVNPLGASFGTPATTTVTITDNDAAGQPNPVFTTPFFVRQHYLDFLAREPEQNEPWSNVLNNCADPNNVDPNAPAAACDRLTVSAAFFGSPEFRLKGFYVFLFYRVAFDRLPAYNEIIPDLRAVTGQTATEVFAKRAAFAAAFTQRAEFRNAYDGLADAAFVAALLARYNNLPAITTPDPANPDGTQKVTLTQSELTSRLAAHTLTRAQVLRAVVQSDEVNAQEFNKAFVAMQYYGYLRRTPEQAGYQAWLNYLNSHPTDFRTMVNGFMNSTEYRLRFGQP